MPVPTPGALGRGVPVPSQDKAQGSQAADQQDPLRAVAQPWGVYQGGHNKGYLEMCQAPPHTPSLAVGAQTLFYSFPSHYTEVLHTQKSFPKSVA